MITFMEATNSHHQMFCDRNILIILITLQGLCKLRFDL